MPRKTRRAIKTRERANAMRDLRLWSARNFCGAHTETEWRALIIEFDARCVRCERRGGYISRDHIIPIALGGMDTIDNIQPLCRKCNSSKGTETYDWKDYRRRNGWSSVAPATAYSRPRR